MGPEASDHLLHIVTKDNFKLSHLYFASPFVGDKMVARALMKDGLEGLATMTVRTRGAMRAYLYEQVMHQLMPQASIEAIIAWQGCMRRFGDDRVGPTSASPEVCLFRPWPDRVVPSESCPSAVMRRSAAAGRRRIWSCTAAHRGSSRWVQG